MNDQKITQMIDGRYFVLDGREIVLTTYMQWMQWFENNSDERMIKQEPVGDCLVSTVFLGLNHSWDPQGPPILFETMVFETGKDGKRDMSGIFQQRCATYDEAEAMHAKAVAWVQGGCQDPDNIHDAIAKSGVIKNVLFLAFCFGVVYAASFVPGLLGHAE
jgi:hypothetical protein